MNGCVKWGLLSVALASTALISRPALADWGGNISGEVSATPAKLRAGVVVRIEKVEGGHFRPPAAPAVMNQKGMAFIPHVLAVLRGTTVKFLNSDTVAHNVYTNDGEKYDLGSWPQGETKTYTFNKVGVYSQLCKIHPEMLAYVVVVDNPYFAVTDATGHFKIEGVPPGSYTLRTWSEKLPEATQPVTVTAGGDSKARFELKKH
jgi:plastocyanin